MSRLIISALIGMVSGFTTHAILNGDEYEYTNSLVPAIIASFIAFILVWVISWFALKQIDKLDEDKR